MDALSQSPTDPAFVQNPYPFYARARAQGPIHIWADYGMPAAFDHATVQALLRDRRLGRAPLPERTQPIPGHLAPFYAIEAHSMLELEPPRHTRLRGLVLRAFTTRRIAALAPGIFALCDDLIDAFPNAPFDLLAAYCTQVPVLTICRLLGVPATAAPQLLEWSHAMVAMYQANRTVQIEHKAAAAAQAFTDYLTDYVDHRRTRPRDDLISDLIAAEEAGTRLSTAELIATCVLLLNAGHEATVHALGNAVKILLETGTDLACLSAGRIDATIEEILRFDPPLHLFTRFAYETIELPGTTLHRGDRIALLLGAANRDPAVWPDPDRFDPGRPIRTNAGFGGGLHFCVGAPLARLEMKIALPRLFARRPGLRLTEPPVYADSYHFHGLTALRVAPD